MTGAEQDAAHTVGGVHASESAASKSATLAARLRWLLVVGLLFANTVWFTMGLVAAAFGGSLTGWGSGAGGLGGWPDLSQTIFSLLLDDWFQGVSGRRRGVIGRVRVGCWFRCARLLR